MPSGVIPERWRRPVLTPFRRTADNRGVEFFGEWHAERRIWTRPLSVIALLSVTAAVLSGCSGGDSQSHNRLIVLGQSIGGVRIGEPRSSVEKALGHGKSLRRGLVWYFGDRLLVDYWVHDRLQTWVGGLETRWPGFHTRPGIRVGSSRKDLRPLHVTCGGGGCDLAARPEPPPDAPGTAFTMHRGKVVRIDVFYG